MVIGDYNGFPLMIMGFPCPFLDYYFFVIFFSISKALKSGTYQALARTPRTGFKIRDCPGKFGTEAQQSGQEHSSFGQKHSSFGQKHNNWVRSVIVGLYDNKTDLNR